MKKLLFALVIVMSLFSCSTSNDSSQTSSVVLLRKAIWNYETTYDYSYQGNKIVKITGSDGSYSNFTYTGDLITKVENTEVNSDNNGHDEFYYSGNNLIQIKEYQTSNLFRKIDYIINNDNTKIRTETIYSGTSIFTLVHKEYYLNDEIVKDEELTSNGSVNGTETYLYDDKNYMFKNVIGYKYILNYYGDGGPSHNIIKTTFISTGFNQTTNDLFEYNSSGYPTTVTSTTQGTPNDVGQFYY